MTTLNNGLQLISQHKIATAAGVGIGGAAIIGGIALASHKNKKRHSKNKRTFSKKNRRRKQKQPYTARKRKDTSHRRVRFTKNNQPYIILASGKARFISHKSARTSRKRKGGRY